MHKQALGTNLCSCTPGAVAVSGLWDGGGLQGCKRRPSAGCPSVCLSVHIAGVGAIRIDTCFYLVRFVLWPACKIAAIFP